MIQYTDRISAEEYLELRTKVGWMLFPLEEAENCIENAYMVISARDDDRAVGVARLLWDGGYVAFLSDVIVDPAYQRQGIGRTLVNAIIQRIRDDMKPGWKVKLNLNSAKGKEPFYKKFGFDERPNENVGAGMDMWLMADEQTPQQ
jgi:GNAT superfamily N-acetyltransferase